MDAPYAVQLIVPAQADSVRLARLVAAALATDAGWTIDDTEDLRIAVSELVALLLEGEEDITEQVELSYQRTADAVQISGRRALDNVSPASPAADAPDATFATGSGAGAAPSDPSGSSGSDNEGVPLDDLALEILRVVVDEHHFSHDPSGRQFHLVKRARNHT